MQISFGVVFFGSIGSLIVDSNVELWTLINSTKNFSSHFSSNGSSNLRASAHLKLS